MPDPRTDLIGDPYTPPPAKLGRCAWCFLRRRTVVISGWTDAPIRWPRCGVRGQHGGSGLLFTGDLIKAVQTESALALKHWWGVSANTVWRWR